MCWPSGEAPCYTGLQPAALCGLERGALGRGEAPQRPRSCVRDRGLNACLLRRASERKGPSWPSWKMWPKLGGDTTSRLWSGVSYNL